MPEAGNSARPWWGIPSVLWTVPIRILIVIDGRINTGHGVSDFGLGPVLATLHDPAFPWVRFEVEVRRRHPLGGFRFTLFGIPIDLDQYDQNLVLWRLAWPYRQHPARHGGTRRRGNRGLLRTPRWTTMSLP